MTMQNLIALRAIADLIEQQRQIISALEKARDLMGGGVVAPVAGPGVALPALQISPAKRTGTPRGKSSFAFTQTIDGVSFSCTEQQHAFVEMLGEHDYVTTAMAVALWDNKKPLFWKELKWLRDRMVAAGVQAQIVNYGSAGYRLEAFTAAEAEA